MTEKEYWEQFAASGRIQDYLTYAAHHREVSTACPDSLTERAAFGEHPYAGFNCSDGNGFKPDAGR